MDEAAAAHSIAERMRNNSLMFEQFLQQADRSLEETRAHWSDNAGRDVYTRHLLPHHQSLNDIKQDLALQMQSLDRIVAAFNSALEPNNAAIRELENARLFTLRVHDHARQADAAARNTEAAANASLNTQQQALSHVSLA